MSGKREDGGQALVGLIVKDGMIELTSQLSVRDYFAAKAMQAMIAKSPFVGNDLSESVNLGTPVLTDEEMMGLRNGISHGAYLYADAMLAEREK